jgi:pyruvate dehydrogenase E1 component beta subunit
MLSDRPAPAAKLFFREAIARAVSESMRSDDRIIVLGQDVGHFGGAYKEFAGLYAEFGARRVRDTPVAEAAMIGLGAGAAAAGLRPLVSITYMDFLMLGLDPLVNYAAKARFKTGGQITAPMVVKCTAGAKGQGVAHSQCIEAWMMAVPGLKVVAPSTPADAYGLLKSALIDDGPVLFVDHKRLFSTAGEVPAAETFVPIGKALVRRVGNDVTITAHAYMTRIALAAGERLAEEGLSCEVIDLRSLAPMDLDAICHSAGRTRALLTLEEGQLTCGIGAEIAFQVRERVGPIRVSRVGALRAPVSSNPVLESACLPDADRVIGAVHHMLNP